LTDSPLFQPFTIGSLTVPNRVVMAPMTRSMSPQNIPHQKVVDYYRRRAEGGTGLIITEGTCVGHKAATGYPDVPFFYGDEALAGWAGPSGMVRPGKKTGHEMTPDDIEDVINAFATAAKEAERLGFDAVEIHGAHGYLIDQFFWSGTNAREDGYGHNKSKFAIDIVRAIRQQVRADFPVILRWSQWKQQDYTARLAETPTTLEAFLAPLADAGVDIFHCSQRRFWEPEFEGSQLNLAGWVKQLTGKPTITVGSVGLDSDFIDESAKGFTDANTASLDGLLERLGANEFDLVAVGRALISNPDWANRVRDNETGSLKAFQKSALTTLV